MKKINLILLVLVIVSFFIVSGTQAAAKDTYNWKMTQPYTSGTMLYNLTESFIKYVEEASNGRIKIKHYPSDLLGDYLTQQESVQTGSQELAYTWPSTGINPKWDIFSIGCIGYNSDHGKKAFGKDGWMLPLMDTVAKECNWKLLGIAPTGATTSSQIVISNQSFDPLNPEGRKCRTRSAQNTVIRYETIGYSVVTMPFSEVSSALVLGTIDAAYGCVPGEFIVYGDAFKYAYLYSDCLYPASLIINLDLWNSLSEEDQSILLEAGDLENHPGFTWEDWENGVIKNYEEDLLPWQILVTPDGDQWATFAEKARAAEWPYIENIAGKEIMDNIRENAVDLPWGKTVDEMNYGYGKILTTEWLTERQGGVYTKNPPPVKK